jgi:hypothetical protein
MLSKTVVKQQIATTEMAEPLFQTMNVSTPISHVLKVSIFAETAYVHCGRMF